MPFFFVPIEWLVSEGLCAVTLGEGFSICPLTIQPQTSVGRGAAYMQHGEGWTTPGQVGALSLNEVPTAKMLLDISGITLQGQKEGLPSVYDHGFLPGCLSGKVARFHRVCV